MDLNTCGQTFDTIRCILTGSAFVTVDTLTTLTRTCPNITQIKVNYGASEVGEITMTESGTTLLDNLGNIGTPMDYYQVKIVDLQTQEPVDHGQAGLVLVSSPCLMNGYYGNDDKTREVVDGQGWYNTGDIATMDNSGTLRYKGRVKDTVNRGGSKVFPAEVEDALHEHGDILLAAVFGIPDKRLGEQVCAWIQVEHGSELTETTVKAFLSDKLSKHKIPEKVIISERDPPLTTSGKISKPILLRNYLTSLQDDIMMACSSSDDNVQFKQIASVFRRQSSRQAFA